MKRCARETGMLLDRFTATNRVAKQHAAQQRGEGEQQELREQEVDQEQRETDRAIEVSPREIKEAFLMAHWNGDAVYEGKEHTYSARQLPLSFFLNEPAPTTVFPVSLPALFRT